MLVESPTYDRPLKILREYGDRPSSWSPWTSTGLIPEELERALAREPTPAFLYTIPTFQNPSGRTLPEARRRRRSSRSRKRTELMILEDDPYGLIRFEGERPPVAVRARARDDDLHLVVLEDDRARAPRRLVHPPGRARRARSSRRANSTYITPVLLGEATVYEFIRRGSFEPNLERSTSLLQAAPRRDARRARASTSPAPPGRDPRAATSSGSSFRAALEREARCSSAPRV